MTCIAVAKNRSGKIMIAGDRRISTDYSKSVSWNVPKIRAIIDGERRDENNNLFKKGDLLLAGTGDVALLQLILDVLEIPKRGSKDIYQYIFNDFYNAIYVELIAHGYGDEHNILNIPENTGLELLIALEGKLFLMNITNPESEKDSSQGLITTIEYPVPYATGCGDGAHAVLHFILDSTKYITQADLKQAVKIMGKISPGCDDKVDLIQEL